jgi:hypothetical protein
MDEKKRKRDDFTTNDSKKIKLTQEDIIKQQKIISALKKSVSCLICQEIMASPHNLECGHAFCFECVFAWFKKSQTCPICRKGISTIPSISWSLQEQIEMLTENLNEEEKNSFNERLVLSKKNMTENSWKLISKPNLDLTDQVFRCTECGWEMNGEECSHCHAKHHEGVHPDVPTNVSVEVEVDDDSDDDSDVSNLIDDEDADNLNPDADYQDDGSDDDDYKIYEEDEEDTNEDSEEDEDDGPILLD